MRIFSKAAITTILATALGLALAAGAVVALRSGWWTSQDSRYKRLRGWQTISGNWTEHADALSNSNYGRGDMLIAQHSKGADYRISADIRFDLLFSETHYGDAGLVIRATDPEQGVDSYRGYYAGLRPDEQTLILGRASYDWHTLKILKLATPISTNSWYHLELAAQGCNLIATATPEGGRPATVINYQDNQCLTEGMAGLRSFYAQASWRNVNISHN